MDVCYTFPGQGAPIDANLMTRIYEKEGRPIFERANDALRDEIGFDITDIILDESKKDLLKKTRFAQPAILVCSIAGYQRLQKKGLKTEMVVGHSLGEYSALVAAGVCSLEDALNLVWQRGLLMTQCIPEDEKLDPNTHFMAAILNTEELTVRQVCLEVSALKEHGIVQMANINSPSQIVIAGNKPAVVYASERFRGYGVKDKDIRGLPVEGPFHCRIMFPAEYGLIDFIDKIPFKKPKTRLIQTYSGQFEEDPEEIKINVLRQTSTSLYWHKTVDTMVAGSRKVCKFVESFSNVLTRLLNRRKKEKKDVEVIDNKEILEEDP